MGSRFRLHLRPARKLALIGPSFTTAIAIPSWFVAAARTPFGFASVGAPDAAKLIALSGLNPVMGGLGGVSLGSGGGRL